MDRAPAMQFLVLGPLEVRHGGSAIPVRGAPVRALLARLLLQAREPVAVEMLFDALWGPAVPQSPQGALQIAVSRLRAALGDQRDRLDLTASGYVLTVADDEIDARCAHALLREGRAELREQRPVEAAARFEAALHLWRGPVLAEFANAPFAAQAAARFNQLRADLTEARNSAWLATDRSDDVLDDINALIEADPWRERLRAQHILALYRGGRQVEALGAYSAYRTTLRRAFGTEPAQPLQALYRGMLRQDPALARGPLPWADASVPPVEATQSRALLDATLERLDDRDAAVKLRLLTVLADAQHHVGDPGWRATAEAAAAIAVGADDPVGVAASAAVGQAGWGIVPWASGAERRRFLDRALDAAAPDDDATRARLLAVVATQAIYADDQASRRRLSDEAVQVARRSGDRSALLFVLLQRFHAIWTPETVAERLSGMGEALALANELHAELPTAFGAGMRMAAALEGGDLAEAERCLAIHNRIARDSGAAVLVWGVALHTTWRAVLRGDLAEAERACHEALELGRRTGRGESEMVFTAQLCNVRWAQGRIGEMAELLDEAAADAAVIPDFGAWLVRARLASGDEAGAARHLEAATNDGFAALPPSQTQLGSLVAYAEVAHQLRDSAGARVLAGKLAPFASQFVFGGCVTYGPVAHTLGLVRSIDDPEAGRAALVAARSLSERLPAPFFAARADQALAQLG